MRQLSKILVPGCFIFCLGGWVYSDSAIAADSAREVKQAALDAAVVAAAAPGALAAEPGTPVSNVAGIATAPGTPVTNVAGIATAPGTPVSNVAGIATTPGTPVSNVAGIATAPGTPVTNVAGISTSQPADTASTNLNTAKLNVGADGVVEQLSFQELEINSALNFLSHQSHRNIIASKDVKGTVSCNLYNVTFQEALNAMLQPNGFDYIEKGNFIYVYTNEELEKIRKRDRKTLNRVYHLKYLTAQDASLLIKPVMSSTGVLALTPPALVGLPTGVTDTGGMNYSTNDTLVINDYAENLADIDKTLKNIDVRPKQVLVEATILNATIKDDNALGIDLVSMSGIDFPTIGSIISPLAGGSSSSSSSSSTGVTTPGQLAGTMLPNGSTQSTIGTNFASQVPPGGLTIGFLSNHISMFVRALESITDTTIVANPKILTLNKQHGEVLIGQQLGYITTQQTTSTTVQTVSFIDVGTKLVFRPFIGDDGYIRMEIHPEDSSGNIDAKGVPQKTTTELTSNVMVKDGRTIVIGGLFREQTTASRGQVPVIGNIPILGPFFRQTSDTAQRSETIALITPHIINDDTALYDESEKRAEDVTRIQLGARSGMQPWGRERMAQLWYSKAQEQLEKGNKEMALMYTDWAINTSPTFLQAIELREDLTHKKVTESSDSSIKSFVRDVLRDEAARTPDRGLSGNYPPPELPAPVTEPTTAPATAPASK